MAPRQEVRKLKEPVIDGDKTIDSITLTYRRKFLRGQQLNFMADDSKKSGGLRISTDALLDIAGKMIGQHPDFLDELHEEDADFVLEQARDFFMGVLGKEKDSDKKPS